MRYKIEFSYDGTNFCGYQKQPQQRSVENEFEKALFSINNHTLTRIYASGRTDKGVHALRQVAHTDLDIKITEYKLKCALNSLLPPDIHVISTESVDNNFNARFNVKSKTYKYTLNMGEYDPLKKNYELQYNKKLDVDKMRLAISYYIGMHDFKNFVSEEAVKDSYVREIFDAHIEIDNNILTFVFIGSGFMKYQIRNMVGILVRIGENKVDISYIKALLEFSTTKNKGLTIAAQGLYLVDVEY